MKTKLLFVSILAGVLFSSFACSQPRRMSIEDRVENLKKELDLSAEQVEKVTGILKETQEKMEDIFDQEFDDRSERRAAMMEIRNDEDKKINELLTAEQKEKYEAFKEERQKRRRERRRN